MPRKPKRVRDPDRSHARGEAVAVVPQPLHHTPTVGCHPGWVGGELTAPLRSACMELLAQTPLDGPGWHPHSGPGEQGNDLPMYQLDLSDYPHKDKWWPVLQQVVAAQTAMDCTTCGAAVASHRIRATDLNQVRPRAAVWPHTDVVVRGGGPSLLLLLQPAQQGGDFRIAREPAVSWREADAGGLTLARRARDAVYVPLRVCGDVICFDGLTFAHEVSRVHGSEPRLTVSVTLTCGRQ